MDEVRILQMLSHPNIARMVDYFDENDTLSIV